MKIKCNFCNGKCIKNGFQSNGNQRYKCCVCQKRQQSDYTYNACKRSINQEIILFTKEGLGIRSTARILKISTTTLLKRIVFIARNITKTDYSTLKSYVYTYDALNRLTNATDNLGKFNESLSYDKNGNITNLNRMGKL